jgi:hypothetical protein
MYANKLSKLDLKALKKKAKEALKNTLVTEEVISDLYEQPENFVASIESIAAKVQDESQLFDGLGGSIFVHYSSALHKSNSPVLASSFSKFVRAFEKHVTI